MKTGNKILLAGATVLVVSILANIGAALHAYRTDRAWALRLDSLLQRRTIRVLVERHPFAGYRYQRFKTREEQQKTGRFSATLFFPDTTPPTPQTIYIKGDTLFIDTPIHAGYFPNAERYIDSGGRERDVLGITLSPNDIPQIKEMKIEP